MFSKRIKGHHLGHPKKSEFATMDDLRGFLNTASPKQKEGVIYFHVPYCDRICSFCSMNRSKLDGELDDYAKYLLDEIDKFSNFNYIKQKSFESIYFGGGTPTILKERHLEQILTAIKSKFNLSPTCEFSFETTLHNLNISKLRLMQDLGVNRYSIGIQTFSDEGRKLLNRTHTKASAIEHLHKIKDEFKGILCTDIIYNYPHESEDDVRTDAKILKDFKVDSASFYSLQFLDGSEFATKISQDYYNIETDKMLHNAFIDEMFKDDEYEFLEYTKINRKGRDEYKYIRLTHAGSDVVPIGVNAGGKIGDFGLFNMKADLQMVGILPQSEQNRRIFTSLFQYKEIKFTDMRLYISDETFSELMMFFMKCQSAGYLSMGSDGLKFSIDGVFWGNTIADEVAKIAQKDFE
ncbi:radical SAM protein [Campylobacter sp. faydin G-105]|uniref:radical SAM protein n=1 Tax=Campylobacter anatolicus TaxID=2829105 RepID=UPI001B91E402|nr:radical SAM protein [Campylobacter anatolicus]MBR8461250.1 radical SAM protein [Campylobacter anatolicus]